MAGLNAPSYALFQWALDEYMMLDEDTGRNIDDWQEVADYAEEEADNWLRSEPGYDMPEGSGEMFPAWVTLVVTPGIKAQIDWVAIKNELKEHLSDYYALLDSDD
jgi:hypothetical protein